MKNKNLFFPAFLLLFLGLGIACRLTSPTPVSWSGTTIAQDREATSTTFAQIQQTRTGEESFRTPTEPQSFDENTPTPIPTQAPDGPWLVYPAPDENGLHAYDVESGNIREIVLPEPVYFSDLTSGLSPDGQTLVLRAGSPLNTDELALYQIDFPSFEVIKVTPLLSISMQRKIINEEDDRVFDTLHAVTHPAGLAWSPDGRYLAFMAALDGSSSDLYMLDTKNQHINRLNGLYSQSITPNWAPKSDWLIYQELDRDGDRGWRSEVVSEISMPGYINHNALYLPVQGSQEEVFLGWANAQSLLSYSLTADGPTMLRQVNVDTLYMGLILQGSFECATFDPESKALAYILSDEDALRGGLMEGVYLLRSGSAVPELLRAGSWTGLAWDNGDMFVARGSQGVLAFSPEMDNEILLHEDNLRISPNGNWMIAWGDGEVTNSGARLYQSPNGNLLQEVTDKRVTAVYWGPGSKNFFIHAEGTLYHVSFPGINLVEVEAGFSLEETFEFIWVE